GAAAGRLYGGAAQLHLDPRLVEEPLAGGAVQRQCHEHGSVRGQPGAGGSAEVRGSTRTFARYRYGWSCRGGGDTGRLPSGGGGPGRAADHGQDGRSVLGWGAGNGGVRRTEVAATAGAGRPLGSHCRRSRWPGGWLRPALGVRPRGATLR